jgi:hypothetical protein
MRGSSQGFVARLDAAINAILSPDNELRKRATVAYEVGRGRCHRHVANPAA